MGASNTVFITFPQNHLSWETAWKAMSQSCWTSSLAESADNAKAFQQQPFDTKQERGSSLFLLIHES